MTDIIALHSASNVARNDKSTNVNSNSTEIHNDDTLKQNNKAPVNSQLQTHRKNGNRGGNLHLGGSPQLSRKEKKITKQVRLDHNGVEINKKNKKKVKISFIDAISTNQLVTIISVVSVDNFKEYNYVSMPSLEDIYVKSKTTCACVIY